MRRLCVMLHQDSASTFTEEDLMKRFHVAGVFIKRRTLSRYLIYFRDKEIVEFLKDEKGTKLYRCSDTNKALAYIEGRFEEYAGQVTPRRPPIRPEGTIRHQPVQKVTLDEAELSKAKSVGVWRKKGKPPGYYHIVTDGFNMKVWTSGKSHVFLTGDWRKSMMSVFGPSAIQKVEHQLSSGNGREGIAIPTKGRLPDKWQGHLPVKSIAAVFSSSGEVTTIRYGYSQQPDGELDRHGPVNEPNANEVEAWLDSELQFKAGVRNHFTKLYAQMDELIELQSKLPDAIGKAVGDATSKAVDALLEKLLEKLKEKPPAPEPEYKQDDKKDDGMMFG